MHIRKLPTDSSGVNIILNADILSADEGSNTVRARIIWLEGKSARPTGNVKRKEKVLRPQAAVVGSPGPGKM